MSFWKKRCKLFTLLLCVTLFLCSCTPSHEKEPEPGYTFTDSTGHSVTVKHTPEKTAVLLSSLAEIWQSAGGNIYVTVGETVERGLVSADAVTLVDSGAGKQINVEALLAAAPDLVLVSADIPAQCETAALLREAGIPVAELRVECFADYLFVLKICTDITARPDLYASLGTAQQSTIAAQLAEQPLLGKRVLFVRAGSSARSVKAKSTEQHFAAAMLSELGATNIADSAPLLLDGLSMEVIVAQDPDYIYFTAMGDEQAARSYVAHMLQQDAWRALTAVREGRYIFLEKDLFHYKPCARWAQAYAVLSEPPGGAA